ncbi:MAG: hypothetical protein V1800_11900 [Candidatus Latescibacterota bacterium]
MKDATKACGGENGPFKIGPVPQFFLDSRFISDGEGVELRMTPALNAGPVLLPERPWEMYRISPSSVIHDQGVYKMWYRAISAYAGVAGTVACPRCSIENPGSKIVCIKCGWPLTDIDWLHQTLFHKCFAVSTDGIKWERPDLGLVEYDGDTKNNIFQFTGSLCVPSVNPLGPPEEKFIALSQCDHKLFLSVSPDGLRWTRKPDPVLPFCADTNNQIIYDPALRKYVAFLRGFPGRRTTVRCEFDNLDQTPWPFTDRGRKPDDTGTCYIEDELETVMDIDAGDPPLPGLDINHISAIHYTDGVYLGFPGMFRKYPGGLDRQGREDHRYFAQGNDGSFETQLAVSRDGRRWTRPDRCAYMCQGLLGELDGGITLMAPGMIHRDNEIYQYYGGNRVTHGILNPGEDNHVGGIFRTVQIKDRFISVSAGMKGGRFVTPLLSHTGNCLQLNIDCQGLGETFVQIRDRQGRVIPGHARNDCDPVDLNQLCHTVRWRGNADLPPESSGPIQLEFFMRSARLYTFTLHASSVP